MSTHNIGFYKEISKIILLCHQIHSLSVLLAVHFRCGGEWVFFDFSADSYHVNLTYIAVHFRCGGELVFL